MENSSHSENNIKTSNIIVVREATGQPNENDIENRNEENVSSNQEYLQEQEDNEVTTVE